MLGYNTGRPCCPSWRRASVRPSFVALRVSGSASRWTENDTFGKGFELRQGPRVAVIGLDCATPQLLFDQLADDVPNINSLLGRGMHGGLESITPPITIPAWA